MFTDFNKTNAIIKNDQPAYSGSRYGTFTAVAMDALGCSEGLMRVVKPVSIITFN